MDRQDARRGWTSGWSVAALALATLAACGDDEVVFDVDGSGDAGGGATDTAGGGDDATGGDEADSTGTPSTATLPTYSGGECPIIQPGQNSLATEGGSRSFDVYVPARGAGGPLLFWYYGTGDNAANYTWMQSVATQYGMTVVVPRAKGDNLFEWPIMSSNAPGAELGFFDDMVACVDDSYGIDPNRIYVSGFSAGALWSTYLVMQRSDFIASAAIFSGGTGSLVRRYETPSHPTPILGLFGGDTDVYAGLVNFKQQMSEFMDGLVADGHFVVGCDHGLGHTVPSDAFDWGLDYVLAQTWGEPPAFDAVPSTLPSYCRVW